MEDGWEERPYGWKKMLGSNSQLLRLKPHFHTAMSATPDKIGPHNLKQNDAVWEHIEFLGYVGEGKDEDFSLRYLYLPLIHGLTDRPREMRFRKGAKFYSVLPDSSRTGFYHDLFNDSDAIIELKTEWE